MNNKFGSFRLMFTPLSPDPTFSIAELRNDRFNLHLSYELSQVVAKIFFALIRIKRHQYDILLLSQLSLTQSESVKCWL